MIKQVLVSGEAKQVVDTICLDWIPVKERLPENNDIMLVSCMTKKGVKNVNRAYYSDGHWHGSGSMSGVTAWMPSPEPYTEVEVAGEEDRPAPVSDLEIKVLIDEGGIFQGLYVSPELKGSKVELMDFVTDDEEEIADVAKRYDTAVERAKKGELVVIS